jgi:putative glutamine amidotransferase
MPSLHIIRLSPATHNIKDAETCHGIVLSGGEDVHPRFYHKPEYFEYCYADDINEKRDEFEFSILETTERKAIPVLGICRGLQVTNVFFGGTLIPDLPTWGKQGHAKQSDGTDGIHMIDVTNAGFITKPLSTAYEANSNHHQAIDTIAAPLIVTAYAKDGVVEAAERKDSRLSFLQLVQWHPERMKNKDSVLSKDLLSAFIAAADRYMKHA